MCICGRVLRGSKHDFKRMIFTGFKNVYNRNMFEEFSPGSKDDYKRRYFNDI